MERFIYTITLKNDTQTTLYFWASRLLRYDELVALREILKARRNAIYDPDRRNTAIEDGFQEFLRKTGVKLHTCLTPIFGGIEV